MSYHSFTTPEKLLQKLIQRYQVPEKAGAGMNEKEFQNLTTKIQLRVANVLKKWLSMHYQELNEQQMENFKSFCDKHVKGKSAKLYIQLQTVLSKKVK
jgi:glycine hydroxymethyltransferase/Rap guanine nucleotide exchange factor 1